MKQIRLILSTLSLLCFFALNAQEMGSWKAFFSYNKVEKVIPTQDKIYALGNGTLFSVDLAYESIETYTKISGLTDCFISDVEYSKELDVLVIVYDNCNIDLIKGNTIVNIADLKGKDISGKTIYGITCRDKFAYLSCGFGIVVVNLTKDEIADTYIIGKDGNYTKVFYTEFVGDKIYALTEEGLKQADSQNHNLADYSNWSSVELSTTLTGIAAFNDHLIAYDNDSCCIYDNDTQQMNVLHRFESYKKVCSSDNNLLVIDDTKIYNYGKDFSCTDTLSVDFARYAYYQTSAQTYWIAKAVNFYDYVYNIYNLYTYRDHQQINKYEVNSPYSSSAAFLRYQQGFLITGSIAPFDISSNDNVGIVQFYDGNKWTTITEESFTDDVKSPDILFLDILDVEVDPQDPRHCFIGSWRSLFELYDFVPIKHYTSPGFSVYTSIGDMNTPFTNIGNRILVGGLCYDSNHNLWMLNMLSANSLCVLKDDGTWDSFAYPEITNKATMKEIFFSENGFMWIVCPRASVGNGIMVIDQKGTPFIQGDDQYKYYGTFKDADGNTLSPSAVRCVAEDKNNAIWIGTSVGPLIVSNQDDVFDSDFRFDRIKITREDDANYADYLLSSDQINAIIVDGGNRKWLASSTSGLYLLSEDGQETIKHFTTDNSPLTSNAITDLAMNQETGELFISTATGLFSYMTDATSSKQNYDSVYVYPNPVTPDFYGDITITGLVANSLVRIADAEGNVIFEDYCNGGTLTWNGRNRSDRRVATGIYFVFAGLEDGSMKMVTKIAFIH